jgi:hypothetical protein
VNGTIRISAVVHKKNNGSLEVTKGKENIQGYDSKNEINH